jgi:hypothetical protein
LGDSERHNRIAVLVLNDEAEPQSNLTPTRTCAPAYVGPRL